MYVWSTSKFTAAVQFQSLLHRHRHRGVWWESLSLGVLHSSFRVWSLLLSPLEVTQPDFVVQKWREEVTSVSLFSWSLSSPWHTRMVYSPIHSPNQSFSHYKSADASPPGAFIPHFALGLPSFLWGRSCSGPDRVKCLWTKPVTQDNVFPSPAFLVAFQRAVLQHWLSHGRRRESLAWAGWFSLLSADLAILLA